MGSGHYNCFISPTAVELQGYILFKGKGLRLFFSLHFSQENDTGYHGKRMGLSRAWGHIDELLLRKQRK